MTGRTYLLSATALAAVIFIGANTLVQPMLAPVRADFTENRLYTLSEGTKETLRELAEPVDVTFVYTRSVGQDYPQVRAYADRVREMLDAYESASGGNLRIREIDPAPFSTAEDEALASGITAVDTDGSDPLYFGLIGRNAVDDERVIPFLSPEQETSLEYNLTRLIDRLDNPEPPTIGVLTGLQGMSGTGKETGYVVLREMARSFEIEPIPAEFQAIPDDVDVLLLAHAPEMSARQEWLVDQFILRGGPAVLLVDPASKASINAGLLDTGERRRRSDLGALSRNLGITLSMDAVADVAGALPINTDNGAGREVVVEQPLFIGASVTEMNSEDIITADLTRAIHFGAAGALTVSDTPRGLTLTPLVMTGPSPSYIPADKAVRDMNPQDVLAIYEGIGTPLMLAARISGEATSAFPAGAPAFDEPADPVMAEIARAEAANAPEHIGASIGDIQVVVIADTDILDDGFYFNPASGTTVADNAALVLNSLDALSSGAGLASLRSRAPSLRPMTRVEDMRNAAQDKFFDEQARLESSLEVAQARLEELQAIGSTDGFFAGDVEADLTDEERSELQQLRTQIVQTRERLRGIERDFRRDIDRLEGTLKAVNIWGGPIFVGLIGLLVWARRRRKSRTAR